MCNRKGLGRETFSFFEQGEECFPEALSRLPQLPNGPGLGPMLPQQEDKGRQARHRWLIPIRIHSLGLAYCSLPPKIRFHWQGKGELSKQQSLLYGSGGLLSEDLGSPFVIWTKDPKKGAKKPRAPEVCGLDQVLYTGHQSSLPVQHSFPMFTHSTQYVLGELHLTDFQSLKFRWGCSCSNRYVTRPGSSEHCLPWVTVDWFRDGQWFKSVQSE